MGMGSSNAAALPDMFKTGKALYIPVNSSLNQFCKNLIEIRRRNIRPPKKSVQLVPVLLYI